MADIKVSLAGMEMDNPVIPASGCFGFGYEFSSYFDPNILGSIALKGTTLHPRFGNQSPRIAETASGMLNAVGLQNPGIDKVISEEIPKMKKVFKKKAIANISGFSIDEYVKTAERFDREDSIGLLEINISCPNVKAGGISFGLDPKLAGQVIKEVASACKKPIFAKLSPNVSDICAIAGACLESGAVGISAINTLLGMIIDLKSKKPILKNITGGLSGPAIFPVALRIVYDIYKNFKVPIMGIGGISSAEDIIEMTLAGASAVQVGAAGLVDPMTWPRLIEELPKKMEKYGIEKLSEIVGLGQLD